MKCVQVFFLKKKYKFPSELLTGIKSSLFLKGLRESKKKKQKKKKEIWEKKY